MTEEALRSAPMQGLLGRDRRQRIRLQRALLAGAMAIIAICAIALAVQAGFAPERPARWLVAYLVGGMLAFVALLRSGLNLRLQDPSLTLPMTVFAVLGMTAAYAISGPARGGFLVMLVCAMVFGAFTLPPRRIYQACAATMALLGVVCAAMPWLDPLRYDGRAEALHFLLCAVTLPVVASVAADLSTTREKWRAQKQELGEALARIQVMATRDELTGLVNRRFMRQLLEAEAVRAQRTGRPACIAMLDLDNFKAINDQLGHGTGDEVLKAFADAAAAAARRSDTVARWGGEEFLWLLPETVAAEAELALQRLREKLAGERQWGPAQRRVTFSAGVAELRRSEPPEAAIERADQALYEAKSQGRDRVVARP